MASRYFCILRGPRKLLHLSYKLEIYSFIEVDERAQGSIAFRAVVVKRRSIIFKPYVDNRNSAVLCCE